MLAGAGGAVIYGLYKAQLAEALAQENERVRRENERVSQARHRFDQHANEAEAAESADRFDDAWRSWDQARAALETEPDAANDEMHRRIDEGLERTLRQIQEKQSRYREAEQALDARLAAGGSRTARLLELRGLIHLGVTGRPLLGNR
jgi:hypothetical protein